MLDPTVKDRAPPPTSWSMQDYTNPQSCFRTFCYFSAHALPTLLFPIFHKMFFALVIASIPCQANCKWPVYQGGHTSESRNSEVYCIRFFFRKCNYTIWVQHTIHYCSTFKKLIRWTFATQGGIYHGQTNSSEKQAGYKKNTDLSARLF